MIINPGQIVRWRTLLDIDEKWNTVPFGRSFGRYDEFLPSATSHLMTVVVVVDNSLSDYSHYGVRLFVPDVGLIWTEIDNEEFCQLCSRQFFLEIVM